MLNVIPSLCPSAVIGHLREAEGINLIPLPMSLRTPTSLGAANQTNQLVDFSDPNHPPLIFIFGNTVFYVCVYCNVISTLL